MLRPLIYSLFFAYPFFISSFFSYFIYNNQYAIYCIIGSDAINITILWGIVLWNTKLPFQVDTWYFSRDSFFYILQLLLLCWVCTLEEITWYWAGLQFLVYLVYFMNQRRNKEWRQKIFRLFGIIHEDDEFDSSQLVLMQC